MLGIANTLGLPMLNRGPTEACVDGHDSASYRLQL